MAQKQASFKISLTKGELGEAIFREYLEARGWIVYFPFTKDRPHYFDMLATKDKEKVIACDVKTKARLNLSPPSTGINIAAYDGYKRFAEKTQVPFYLVFIDDKSGEVHFAEIKNLPEGRRISGGKIIIWPLASMKYLFNIEAENIKLLTKYDQRNHIYIAQE